MPSTSKPLCILQLSDIHFALPQQNPDVSHPCLAIRRVIADLADIQPVKSTIPDVLILSGDILHLQAGDDDVSTLIDCLQELVESINKLRINSRLASINPYNIYICPGDSDISVNENIEKGRFYKFLQKFYGGLGVNVDDIYDVASNHQGLFSRTFIDENLKLFVSIFDSCVSDGKTEVLENGRFGKPQLQGMSDIIENISMQHPQEWDQYLKIAVFHHHIQFIPELADDAHYRICVDTPDMMHHLEKYNYDLVIHGHKHKPAFDRFSPPGFGVTSWKELLSIGAGHLFPVNEIFYYDLIQVTPGRTKEQVWAVSTTFRKFISGVWSADETQTKTLHVRRHQKLIEGTELEGVFGGYIENIIQDYEDFDSQGNRKHLIEPHITYDIRQYYVDPAAWDITSGGRIHDPIDYFVEDWLKSDGRNHVTLLGDYGFGKTSFSWHLAHQLAVDFKSNPLKGSRVPLLISLHGIGRISDLRLFITTCLEKYEIELEYKEFWNYLENGRLLVILDGFDEMESRVDEAATLSNWKALSKLAVGNSKILITCRTPYFKSQAHVDNTALPGEETEFMKDVRERPNFEVLELREWGNEQISKLLEKFWRENWKEYWMAVVSANPDVVDFARRPLFLDIIIRLLPNIIQSGKSITLDILFEMYVQKTLERDADISRLDSSRKLRILQTFAYEMITRPGYLGLKQLEVNSFVKKVLSGEQFTGGDIEKYSIDFLNSGFLVRNSQGYYTFQSGLFAGFLTARKLHAEILDGILDNFDLFPLPTEVVQFLSGLLKNQIGLLQKFINDTKHKPFEKCLYRGGNAITLLRLMGDNLSGQDYSNTVLRNANLSGADLSFTHFDNADLCDSVLESAILNNSVFLGTDLTNVRIGEINKIGTLKVSPDGVLVATGDNFGVIKIWDFYKRELRDAIDNKSGDIWSISWKPSKSEHKLVVGSLDKTIRIWDIDKREQHDLGKHNDRVLGVQWHPDGRFIASCGSDGQIKIWDSITDQLEWSFKVSEEIYCVAWSPDGRYLAITHGEHSIDVWDFQTRSIRLQLKELRDTAWNVSWDPKGFYLASGSRDTTLRVWDMKYGHQIEKFGRQDSFSMGHIGAVLYVTWNPIEDFIASSGGDHTVIIWNWAIHKLVSTHQGHTEEIWGLDWHPSGKFLLSGGNDGKIMIWETGKPDPSGFLVQYPRCKAMDLTRAKGLSKQQIDLVRQGGATRKDAPPSWIKTS